MDTEPASETRSPDAAANPLQQLRQAEALEREGRFVDALAILQGQMAVLPPARRPWPQLSRLLVSMKHEDEAEALLAEAQQHVPTVPVVFIRHAQLAEARLDWAAAAKRWTEIRTRFPGNVQGWLGGTRALRNLNDLDASDALITEAMEHFPGDQGVALAWADIPRLRRDVPMRVERWAVVREKHPLYPGGFTAGALALRDANRLTEAEAVASEGCARFPDDRDVHRTLGVIRIRSKNLMGAEEALQKAVSLDPKDAASQYHLASVAFARGAWDLAVQRATEAKTHFPDDDRFDALIRSASAKKPAVQAAEPIEPAEDVSPPAETTIRAPVAAPRTTQRPSLLSRLLGKGR